MRAPLPVLVPLCCVLLTGVLPPCAAAPQEPGAQDPQRRDQPPPKLVIEPGEHVLTELLGRAALFLRHNYVFNEAELEKLPEPTVTVQNPLALDAQQCEEVIGQLAFARDLVRVPLHPELGLYQWVWLQGAEREKAAARPVRLDPAQVRARRRAPVFVLTAVPLEHAHPNQAVQALRPLLGSGSRSTADQISVAAASGAVVLSGLCSRVAEALEVLEVVDRPQPQQDPEMRELLQALESRVAALEKRAPDGDAKK